MDTTIVYPEFVPNQILTDGQLNQLREHLDREDRLTRLRLTGTGIVCGLHGAVVTGPPVTIQISSGFGLTSDGELLGLCDAATTTFTHFRTYADPDRDENRKLRYEPWREPTDSTDTTQRDIKELLTAQTDPPTATGLTAAHITDLSDRVLVLYLEHEPVELNSCLVTSCDNKGRNINVTVRALLVRREDLTGPDVCPEEPALHRIKRLHAKNVPQPTSTAAQIAQAFSDLIVEHADGLGLSIKALFELYAAIPLLNMQTIVEANPLAGKLTGVHIPQYRYGALLDYAAAYNETATAAYSLVRACCPQGRFGRHLMLGRVDAVAGFRHEFSASALRNAMHGEIDRVRELFDRLRAMINRLNLAGHPAAVSIRPSHTAAYPLERRARPFYFDHADLDALWRPHARCTLHGDWPWYRPATAVGFLTDYADTTFLRIEGHVGDVHDSAFSDIAQRRDAANIEFHLLRSFLDDGLQQEQAAHAAMMQLAENPQFEQAAREAFENIIGKGAGDGDINNLAGIAQKYAGVLAQVDGLTQDWVDVRARRQLHCDDASLAQDYLGARSELLCLAARLRAAAVRTRRTIDLLDDEALLAPGLEGTLDESVIFTLVDHLTASLLSAPEQWDTAGEVTALLPSLDDLTLHRIIRFTLRFALLALEGSVQQIVRTLPPRLAEFPYALFALRFRLLLARVHELWSWSRVMGVQFGSAGSVEGKALGDAPWHSADEPAFAADMLALQGCALARFATVFQAYEGVRARDLSLFRNLARIDGLEHLAGVSKGGTFVLVCSDATDTGTVIADFSLDGCLPCCCRFDANALCLPPLALPDVRVVTVGEDDEGVALQINVVANDCDLNAAGDKLTISQLSDTSARGGKLAAHAENGTIFYAIGREGARPGVIDRFSYRLQLEGKCSGEATGDVIVIFASEPALTGRIEGRVTGDDVDVSNVDVKIVDTGASTTTDDKGDFSFERVPASTYSLVASKGDLVSEQEIVTVGAGQTAHVELILLRGVVTGAINVTVRDDTGAVFPDVPVRVVNIATGVSRTVGTDGVGTARFAGVPAGEYKATAQVQGFAGGGQCDPDPIPVNPQQTTTAVINMGKRSQVGVAPRAAIDLLAEETGINVVEARNRVRATMLERHTKVVVDFNRATDDPRVLTSEPYVQAAAFLGKQLTDPASTDEAIVTAYDTTSTALATAARQASGDEKTAYQDALTAITVAYLDRIALSNPRRLTADASNQVRAVTRTLKSAGVSMDDAQLAWGGARLKDTVNVGSTEAIGRLLV